MSRVILHRQGRAIASHTFTTLLQIADQEELLTRYFAGRQVGAVTLATLIGESRSPMRQNHFLTLRSSDGYASSVPWQSLDECFLVYRIGNAPLPAELGGPFRVVVADGEPRSCLKHIEWIDVSVARAIECLPEYGYEQTAPR